MLPRKFFSVVDLYFNCKLQDGSSYPYSLLTATMSKEATPQAVVVHQ